MEANLLMPTRYTTSAKSVRMNPHIPIRVFLLSDHHLLRHALARALKSQPDISLVGAQEFSLSTAAEIAGSTCDVLLVDPVNASALDTEVLDHLQESFSHLRIVMIDVEAKIADVLSVIRLDSGCSL